MKLTTLSLCFASTVLSSPAQTLFYGLDFTDPGWKNDTTGMASEFQTNGAGMGNSAGWDATHTLANINNSGIGVTMALSHQPNAWNIESRPALEPYFPSQHGAPGEILRVWNRTQNIPSNETPTVTLTFTQAVSLQNLGLEGYRRDDAFKVQAYDVNGDLVSPNWADPSVTASTDPGAPLADVPINLLTTTGVNGATGAEAFSSATFLTDPTEQAFLVINRDDEFERGASVLDYNLDTAVVKSIVYSMIEVDSMGDPTGEPSDQSMYIGGGVVAQEFSVPVPEPSGVLLISLSTLGFLIRRR